MEQNEILENVVDEIVEVKNPQISKDVIVKAGIAVGGAAIIGVIAFVAARKLKGKFKKFMINRLEKKGVMVLDPDSVENIEDFNTNIDLGELVKED